MKIGILTQPLYTNYGGLLQAYALQTVLKRMGHEVWTEDRRTFPLSFKYFLKCIIGPFIGRYYPTKKQYSIISQHTRRFVKENIRVTDPVVTNTKEIFQKYQIEAYIVGSDQVWRPRYSPCITNYFLDFTKDSIVKRIAYSASFGVEEWEFTPEQTQVCSTLLKRFDAVSVREDSGVLLCGKYLGVDAVCLVDPTMLLEKDDYIQLIEKDSTQPSSGKLLVYVLDQTEEKQRIIRKVSESLSVEPFFVGVKKQFEKVGMKKINECIYPPVTAWLQGFMEADYVLTDSFHGTVFALIFNKPFIVIGNERRGMSRLTSLLKLFDLKNRLVISLEEVNDSLINEMIDFVKVNEIRKIEQKKAFNFLNSTLK